MAETVPTVTDRTLHAGGKTAKALKWMLSSGIVTMFLVQIVGILDKVSEDMSLKSGAIIILVLNVVINTLIFAAGKFTEGE